MSRKRPAGQIAPCQMLEIATSISNSSSLVSGASTTTFTDGAIEGLRISHHAFLQRVAEELAKQDKDVVSQTDVVAALTEMGLSEMAQEAVGLCEQQQKQGGAATGAKGIKPKKWKKLKSKVKWTKEMEEEQEKLLAQSKEAMEQAQGK
jgi:hypothetical protein